MKDAIILFGGVFMVGLPFIIIGCVISWARTPQQKIGRTISSNVIGA
jgi:hypothetical protein